MNETEVVSKSQIEEMIGDLAEKVMDGVKERSQLAFVGIHTRGVILLNRILELVQRERQDIACGTLDISLYRDDSDNWEKIPVLHGSDLPFQLDDSHIVLFDDVLYTGRTTRAAMDAIFDYGRPACIELAVLVDRGHRELPIAATYSAHSLETGPNDYVRVEMEGTDNREGVFLRRP